MLSERYRIVGLLGRGGMGEVYRADDLKLGQTVALKFLPPELEGDATRLQMLLAEVRHARQVSHPNICRVYDVGEAGGSHFIAMEFVDGEDLSSLLRRIGHLPADKATQVARQVCAGIAAAHDQGILHRDLKPANIMLDGRGRARITDFGLALATVEASPAQGNVVGTPAYMAPEQILTGTATPRSDIYALGLILHELFTGRRVFASTDFAELRAHHLGGADPALSGSLDPAVERVVARCLARDPRERPSSALQVAAALPGGDPLAAALAAGETPSPELVASATTVGAMPLRIAIACMVASALLLVGTLSLRSREYAAFTTPITTLSLRADELLRASGVAKPPRHTAEGFLLAPKVGATSSRKGGAAPDDVFYWRRWSPLSMIPEGIHRMAPTGRDPAHEGIGSAMVVLDRGGRLAALDVVAASDSLMVDAPADSLRAPLGFVPFGPFLAAAGFDTTRLVAVRPRRAPGVYAERVVAWQEAGSASRDAEAGAIGSRVVHFALTDSAHSTAEIIRHKAPSESGNAFADWFNSLFFTFGSTVATLFLARRNLLAGRGDRRGATRLAIFVFAVNVLESVFTHPLGQRGVPSLLNDLADGRGVGHSLLHAVTMWFAYVAIEPYVRRVWPDMLVGWARLVSGRVRDPLVGRDVVIGGVAGLALCLITILARKGLIALGWDAPQEFWGGMGSLGSMGVMAYTIAWSASVSVLNPLWTLVWVLLVHFAVRRRTWAAVIAWGLNTAFAALTATEPGTLVPTLLEVGLGGAILMFILVRWGLLAGIVAGFVASVVTVVPATLDLSAWYIDRTALGIGVVALLLAWGFKNAVAGQALFGDPLEEKRPSVAS